MGALARAKLRASPSGSLAETRKLRVSPSFTVRAPMGASTGGRLTSPTVRVTCSLSLAMGTPLSVTLMMGWKLPAWVKPGVQLNSAVPSPLSDRVAPVGALARAKLRASPSGSVAETRKLRVSPSFTVRAPMGASSGGRLTSPTVRVTCSLSLAMGTPLSVTLMMGWKLPAWVKPGVQLNSAVPSPLSDRVAPVGALARAKLRASPSGSVAETRKLRVSPSFTVRAPMGTSSGGRLTLVTWSTNVWLLLRPVASVAVTVTV